MRPTRTWWRSAVSCPLVVVAVALASTGARAASTGDAPTRPRASIARAPRLSLAPAQAAPAPPDADRENGIFGPLRIGPVVSVAFPRPSSIELLGVYDRGVALGIEYSSLPSITVDGITARAYGVTGELRWFVLQSAFFLGLGVGAQSLTASGERSGYRATMDASKVFVTPRIGVLWTFGPGFSVGADVGVELPVAHQETVTPALPEMQNADLLVALTRRPLPDVHLARLGWLF
jgi:hypothetical protein